MRRNWTTQLTKKVEKLNQKKDFTVAAIQSPKIDENKLIELVKKCNITSRLEW